MAGNVYLLEAAKRAEGSCKTGCRFFAGYQSHHRTKFLSICFRRIPVGGSFVQGESEFASVSGTVLDWNQSDELFIQLRNQLVFEVSQPYASAEDTSSIANGTEVVLESVLSSQLSRITFGS